MVLTFTVLASLHALTMRPYLPGDEMPHTGYALLVAHGKLPRLDTPTPLLPGMPHFVTRMRVYTAHHPPLYYALVAAPLRALVALGHPRLALIATRLVTVGMSAAGILALVALALLLEPRRPQIAVAAAGLGTLLPIFVQGSGAVYNDALGVTTAVATLAAAVLALVRGPTWGRLLLLALAATAAALTRASGLPFAALAVMAAAGAVLLHSPRPPGARVLLAGLHGFVVAAAVLLGAGWFYLRNLRLYGDFTGASYNVSRFSKRPPIPFMDVLLSWSFWRAIYDQLWGRLASMQYLAKGGLAVGGRVIALVAAAGLLVAAMRYVGNGRWPLVSLRSGRLWGWLVTVAALALMMMALSKYVAASGAPNARYLYSGLPSLGLIAAVGLDALPGARRGLPSIAVLLTQVVLNLVMWATWLSRTTRGRPSLLTAVDQGVRAGIGLPSWLVMLVAVALLGFGLALSARSLWVLSAAAVGDTGESAGDALVTPSGGGEAAVGAAAGAPQSVGVGEQSPSVGPEGRRH